MNIVLSCESEVRVVPADQIRHAWISRASERRVKLGVVFSDGRADDEFTTAPMVQAKAQDLLERITAALVSIHHAPLQKEQADEPSAILSDAPPSGSATPTPVDAAGELPSVEVPDAATAWLDGTEP